MLLTIEDLDLSLIAQAIAAQDQDDEMTYPLDTERGSVTTGNVDIIIITKVVSTTRIYKHRPGATAPERFQQDIEA